MSLYGVNKCLHTLRNDPAALPQFQAACDEFLRRFPLAAEEAQALKSRDIPALYRMGAHFQLIQGLASLLQINLPEAYARVGERPARQSQPQPEKRE